MKLALELQKIQIREKKSWSMGQNISWKKIWDKLYCKSPSSNTIYIFYQTKQSESKYFIEFWWIVKIRSNVICEAGRSYTKFITIEKTSLIITIRILVAGGFLVSNLSKEQHSGFRYLSSTRKHQIEAIVNKKSLAKSHRGDQKWKSSPRHTTQQALDIWDDKLVSKQSIFH